MTADVHKNSVVYGIVTTPTDWTFLRYCNKIIEKHEIALLISNSEISSESSKETTGKKYTPCYPMTDCCDDYASGTN